MQSVFSRYIEGGNRYAAIVVPALFLVVLWRYVEVSSFISKFEIDQQLVYSYSFNALAVAIGALLSLFTFLASRPTQFLQRIQRTILFTILLNNLQSTIILCSVSLVLTFLIGVTNIFPAKELTTHSVLVVAWSCQLVANFCFIVRSVRSAFIALASDF